MCPPAVINPVPPAQQQGLIGLYIMIQVHGLLTSRGGCREPQVTQVSHLSLLKVSEATAQPEGANYWECVFELPQSGCLGKPSAFFFTLSPSKYMINVLSFARPGWSSGCEQSSP